MNKLNNDIKKNFTIIPNDVIRNKNISDRARFIFCYMASMPEDWKFYQGAMAKELGYTKDTLRKYIEELLESGYLYREQRREEGKFDSYDYTLNYTPSGKKADTVKNGDGKKPTREKSSLINKDFKEKKTITNIDLKESSKNSKEFCQNEEIEIIENCKKKINPFQLVAQVEKEKGKSSDKKEKEKIPTPTYEAFTIFCQTFEQLSGANYPTDQNGHYIMMPKDAGNMVYLMRFIDKIDRNGNSHEALKIFMQAAWSLNDKWLKSNFTIANLYSQASKIFTAYQTSSPAAKDKAFNDKLAELLAQRMAKFED